MELDSFKAGDSTINDCSYKDCGGTSRSTCQTNSTGSSSSSTPSNMNRFQVLCHEQVSRLHEVMESEVPLYGRKNYPTLLLRLKDLIAVVRDRLIKEGIEVRDVRINGGAASYIIGKDGMPYNDVDLLFGVDLSMNSTLQKIKTIVLESLHNFLPKSGQQHRFSESQLKEGYVHKMIRIHNCNSTDCWSLISLGSLAGGQTVELKFVDKMRRQFEFTVDSFQIILDSLLTFYGMGARPITEHFYPTVVAESVSGSFQEALYHLNNKLIATRNPEEIRGGGLLKYCKLLVENYHWIDNLDVHSTERYMCSRFFIDFPDLKSQRAKLEAYLVNHFVDEEVKVAYLSILFDVVMNSTVCLMNHERRQTLHLIQLVIHQITMDIEARQNIIQLEPFNGNDWVLDQVFYGTQYFPTYPMNGYSYTTRDVGSPLSSPSYQTVYYPPQLPYGHMQTDCTADVQVVASTSDLTYYDVSVGGCS